MLFRDRKINKPLISLMVDASVPSKFWVYFERCYLAEDVEAMEEFFSKQLGKAMERALENEVTFYQELLMEAGVVKALLPRKAAAGDAQSGDVASVA